MSHPVSKSEILTALETNEQVITGYFATVPDPPLFAGDPERWSPAHHLVHLAQASNSVAKALRTGKLPAHPTGRSRSYVEIRDAAASSLASAEKERLLEMGRVVVIAPGTSRDDVIAAFHAAGAELRASTAPWSEEALDVHALSHPLIGEMTVREMLFFTVVHERHHLRLVQTRVESRPL